MGFRLPGVREKVWIDPRKFGNDPKALEKAEELAQAAAKAFPHLCIAVGPLDSDDAEEGTKKAVWDWCERQVNGGEKLLSEGQAPEERGGEGIQRRPHPTFGDDNR